MRKLIAASALLIGLCACASQSAPKSPLQLTATVATQITQPAKPLISPWWTDPWFAGFVEDVQMVRLRDGRDISLYCLGSGGVTVILEPGPGSGASVWRGIHPRLAAETRTCVYSRAGIGLSTPGPMPRDATARTSDLEELLSTAKLRPPYLMIAHSAGAYHTRLFAYRNLKDLAGMVLIDPAGDNQIARASEILPPYAQQMQSRIASNETCAKPHTTPELVRTCETTPDPKMPSILMPLLKAGELPTRYATEASEMNAMFKTDDALLAAQRRSLGDLPVIVLTAENSAPKGLPEAQAKAFSDLWRTMHREMAAETTKGVEILIPRSAHSIHDDRPEVVIAAVRDILARNASRP